MINVDLRRYGTDKEYQQFINGYIAGADIDETPVECQLVRSVKEATDEELEEVVNGNEEKTCGDCKYADHKESEPPCNSCDLSFSNYMDKNKKVKIDFGIEDIVAKGEE